MRGEKTGGVDLSDCRSAPSHQNHIYNLTCSCYPCFSCGSRMCVCAALRNPVKDSSAWEIARVASDQRCCGPSRQPTAYTSQPVAITPWSSPIPSVSYSALAPIATVSLVREILERAQMLQAVPRLGDSQSQRWWTLCGTGRCWMSRVARGIL